MQHKKKNISRNKWRQVGKVLCKLMINTIRGKTMENVRNRIDVRVANKSTQNGHQNQTICCTKYLTII